MAAISTKSYYTQATQDSSKGYAKAASHASYQYYNAMSWSMWVLAGPGNSKHIWSLWEQVSGNNRSWMFSTQSDGTFRTLFSWDGTNFSLHKTANAIFDFSWKHIVVTFNNGSFNVYVNGVLQTMNQTIAWGGGSNRLHNPAIEHIIGSHSPSNPPADTGPGGCVSNFTLWNKVLSGAEVTELYNNGTPANPTTHSAAANLTNWLRLDQTDSSSTIVDQKTSSANMTITESGTSGYFNQSDNYPYVGQASDIATAVLDAAVEGSFTLKESVRLMLAALAGKISGSPTATITIRDINDTKDRIVATVDGNGNRTAVTKDVS